MRAIPAMKAVALVALLSLVLLLPIKLPYSVKAPGRLAPAREWILCKGQDGQVFATLHDRTSGAAQSYSVTEFERGDAVEFVLRPAVAPGAHMQVGDTVGVMHSNKTDYQLAELTGELATAVASLDFYATGEKEPVVREARQLLARAREQARQQEAIVGRLVELRERDLISEEEAETAQSTLEIYRLNAAAAEAGLQTVQTGSKNEQIALIRSRIEALDGEIKAVRRRLEHLTVVSPLSGVVFRCFWADTLVAAADTTSYVVVMPVHWEDRHYLALQQEVTVSIVGVSPPPRGKLIQIGGEAQVLGGRQVLLATAVVQPGARGLAPGLIAQCSIACDPTPLLEYLRRTLASVFT